ncbi:MAG: hypothetical protein WBE18_05170 [Gammaproteobacteria bacterium]
MSTLSPIKADSTAAHQNSPAGVILRLLQDALQHFEQHLKMGSQAISAEVMKPIITNYKEINRILNTDSKQLFEVGNEAVDSLNNKIIALLNKSTFYFKNLPAKEAFSKTLKTQFDKVAHFFLCDSRNSLSQYPRRFVGGTPGVSSKYEQKAPSFQDSQPKPAPHK